MNDPQSGEKQRSLLVDFLKELNGEFGIVSFSLPSETRVMPHSNSQYRGNQ